MESIFTEVKARLNLIEAAQYYGVQPNKSGFVNCIFHSDRTPSMKLYPAHFHCYGCGQHGDIITLTAQLFGLPPYQAAQKLAQDFHITKGNGCQNMKPIKSERQIYIEQEKRAYNVLNFYCSYLEKCREDFKPTNPNEDFHPLFIESLTQYEQYNYYRDIFITGTDEERQEFMTDCKEQLATLEKRFTQKNIIEKEHIA
jgi:hypothetical protein